MKYRIIENSKISVIGQGWGTLSDYRDEKKYINAIKTSVNLGINFIDTAEIYGNGDSERIIGKSISGMREKVFIATKVSPEHLSYKDVKKSAEASLRRLNVEYVDLYQIHWPNPGIDLAETMKAMDELVKEGKTRYVGVCNFTLKKYLEAQTYLKNRKIVSIQNEYNLLNRSIEDDMLPYCETNNVITIAYMPLAQGKMAGKRKIAVLENIAGKYKKTVAEIVLNWLVSHKPVIAVVHSTNPAHIKENADSTEYSMLKEDMELINSVFTKNCAYVLPSRIRLTNAAKNGGSKIYENINEAMENRHEYHPSPIELSEEIKKEGSLLKPIRIIKTKDESGKYDYDLIGGQVRYWGWVIAKGAGKQIYANIEED